MKVGDLITFESTDPLDRRCVGTILGFDIYRGEGRIEGLPSKNPERIIEVLWNIGTTGWILESRVEVVQ